MKELTAAITAETEVIKSAVGKLSKVLETNRQMLNLMEQAWQEGAISDEKPPEAFMDENGYIRVK